MCIVTLLCLEYAVYQQSSTTSGLKNLSSPSFVVFLDPWDLGFDTDVSLGLATLANDG